MGVNSVFDFSRMLAGDRGGDALSHTCTIAAWPATTGQTWNFYAQESCSILKRGLCREVAPIADAKWSSVMKLSQDVAYALHAMMHMVRHSNQLPATAGVIAKTEGIPIEPISKILRDLTEAGYIRLVDGPKKGYVFAGSPEDISLLELFEVVEGEPLFDDCPLRHCECGGTRKNCHIFAQWISATKRIKVLFEETTIVDAARNHPEHVFDKLPEPNNGAGQQE